MQVKPLTFKAAIDVQRLRSVVGDGQVPSGRRLPNGGLPKIMAGRVELDAEYRRHGLAFAAQVVGTVAGVDDQIRGVPVAHRGGIELHIDGDRLIGSERSGQRGNGRLDGERYAIRNAVHGQAIVTGVLQSELLGYGRKWAPTHVQSAEVLRLRGRDSTDSRRQIATLGVIRVAGVVVNDQLGGGGFGQSLACGNDAPHRAQHVAIVATVDSQCGLLRAVLAVRQEDTGVPLARIHNGQRY